MPGPTRESMTSAHGLLPGRCVVLASRDRPTPEALLQALGSRGMTVQLVHDEPGVMARLAGVEAGVLVIVEPRSWSRLAELAYAVRSYHPRVLCWQYAEAAGNAPRLATLDQAVLGPQPLRGEPPPGEIDARGRDCGYKNGASHDGAEAGPIGRLVGRRRPVEDLLVKLPGHSLTTSEIVTRQELTMLLGPLPGEVG